MLLQCVSGFCQVLVFSGPVMTGSWHHYLFFMWAHSFVFVWGVHGMVFPDGLVLVQFECRSPDIHVPCTSISLACCFLFEHMVDNILFAMCSSVLPYVFVWACLFAMCFVSVCHVLFLSVFCLVPAPCYLVISSIAPPAYLRYPPYFLPYFFVLCLKSAPIPSFTVPYISPLT